MIILLLFFSEFIYYRSWNEIQIQNKRYIKEGFNGSLINDNIIIRAPKGKIRPFSKILPFTQAIKPPHSCLQTYNITKNEFNNDIILKDKSIAYEDGRVFKVSNNKAILSYVKIQNFPNKLSQLIARYISLFPQKIIGPEIVLNFDGKVHKNWILINGENELDTHWTSHLHPYHHVMRVNMITGEITKGWRTKSPKSAKKFTRRYQYG